MLVGEDVLVAVSAPFFGPGKIGLIIAGERPALFRKIPRERSCNVASSPTFHFQMSCTRAEYTFQKALLYSQVEDFLSRPSPYSRVSRQLVRQD